jgi:predicted transcriptional regulator
MGGKLMNENGQEASALMGTDDLRRQTAQIVSAHVSHNAIVSGDLPALIGQVYGTLQGLGKSPEPVPVSLVPAVPIRKSVTPDWLICLEDGLKLKMLKRHLRASFGMTPDEYRERWGLPGDYPMVAPNYAKQRSAQAKTSGMGTKRSAAKAQPVVTAVPAKRSRSRKPA